MIPAPPQLEQLPYGTRLIAGMGESTVVADFDFETYSPAGFVWNPQTNKFDLPQGAPKKGLPGIGAAVYSEHPDAEVLSLAYDLKDGQGRRLWRPGLPLPIDLFMHVQQGRLLEAWNVAFERWIWKNICVPKYGFPRLPDHVLRCAMAKSRAHALPGHLADAGDVLNITHKKHADGKRLLNLFSIPRNPTKNDPRTRILPSESLEDASKLYAYNLQDIVAEAEISSLVPDLSPDELEFWQADQAINVRGIQIDIPAVRDCIAVIEQAYTKYNAELREITLGYVTSASEVAKLKYWIEGTSLVRLESLDEETITEILKTPLPVHIRRVLEIRQLIGSAAVKKLYAMVNTSTRAGRIHDMFAYHSARTGRAAGSGVQPQNLPNSGAEVRECLNCARSSGLHKESCPWCGSLIAIPQEWNPGAVNQALETLKTQNLTCVEYYWDNPIELISGCLRGMFIAAPGHDLICADYSAIEAVVLAMLAGEQWRMDVFRTHAKIYEMSASKIIGTPFDEIVSHKVQTGKHHESRHLGKVAELACFAPDTQVLTHRGYVGIKDILLSDKLWDGQEWVNHEGLLYKGKRKTLRLDGVKMTPEHPINTGHSWTEAKKLVSNKNMLRLALEIGSANLPFWASSKQKKKEKSGWFAIVAHRSTKFLSAIYITEKAHGVIAVLKENQEKHLISNTIGDMKIFSRIKDIAVDCSIVFLRRLADAITPKTDHSLTTVIAEYPFMKYGEKIKPSFYDTSLLFRDGILKGSKWIELMLTGIMSRAISNLLQNPKTHLIKGAFRKCREKLLFSNHVYDIVNAGHRNCFTIKTSSGHLLVHNSGYGGWIGAWKNFGADKFLDDERIKQAILAWRRASPAIVEFWGGQQRDWRPEYYGLEGAAVQAVLMPGTKFSHKSVSYLMRGDALYCRLPSGRHLTYHRPRLSPSQRKQDTYSLTFEGYNSNPKYGVIGWTRMETYGGKLTENVVQAVSRDILAHAIVNLERRRYPVVMHVHDEIVSEIPEDFGSLEEFETIMSTLPAWCSDWPIRTSGWRGKRYAK